MPLQLICHVPAVLLPCCAMSLLRAATAAMSPSCCHAAATHTCAMPLPEFYALVAAPLEGTRGDPLEAFPRGRPEQHTDPPARATSSSAGAGGLALTSNVRAGGSGAGASGAGLRRRAPTPCLRAMARHTSLQRWGRSKRASHTTRPAG